MISAWRFAQGPSNRRPFTGGSRVDGERIASDTAPIGICAIANMLRLLAVKCA